MNTQEFFSSVARGEKALLKKYEPMNDKIKDDVIDNSGFFDEHIFCSIPYYREHIISISDAIAYHNTGSSYFFLDIGASNGSLIASVSKKNALCIAKGVDVNTEMKKSFDDLNKTDILHPVSRTYGATYELVSFMDDFEDIKAFKPVLKYNIVNESMTFQFVSDERKKHIQEVKENLLEKNGLFITSEKLLNDKWEENEKQKDRYKAQYFSKEEMTAKSKETLEGMNQNLISLEEYKKILTEKFAFVRIIWQEGNFFSFACSDDLYEVEKFHTNYRKTFIL